MIDNNKVILLNIKGFLFCNYLFQWLKTNAEDFFTLLGEYFSGT